MEIEITRTLKSKELKQTISSSGLNVIFLALIKILSPQQ